MQGRSRFAAGSPSAWMTPRVAAVLAGLVVACALGAAGLVALTSTGPVGATPASDLLAAPDGGVHVVGTVERTWKDGASSTTHIALASAGEADFLLAGPAKANYAPGDFVEVAGSKAGAAVRVESIHHVINPVDRAAPFLGAAAVAFALLALPLLAAVAKPGGQAGARGGTASRLASPFRWLRERSPRRAPPPPQ